tara:strand:+ start:575 stop:706 length:132 start_codon:yes stop_codon:yes gene_type:complete
MNKWINSTTIKVKNTTRDRLKKRGMKGDTYDDIIQLLLDSTEL